MGDVRRELLLRRGWPNYSDRSHSRGEMGAQLPRDGYGLQQEVPASVYADLFGSEMNVPDVTICGQAWASQGQAGRHNVALGPVVPVEVEHAS
jgi:hypothetical protein